MKYLKWAGISVVAIIALIIFANLDENKKMWVMGIAYLTYSFWQLAKSIDEKNAQINRRLDYIELLIKNREHG